MRFGFINLAGCVVSHTGHLIIRLSVGHPAYELLLGVRRMGSLWTGHASLAAAPGPP
jgi:hypothetical protein